MEAERPPHGDRMRPRAGSAPSRVSADEVDAIMRNTAESTVLPRYRPGQSNDLVDADVEHELSERLKEAVPGSLALGEEEVAAGHGSFAGAPTREGYTWVIDPIDGSRNFAAGRGPFVMMVVLLVDGRTALSVIHDPLAGVSAVAEPGCGAVVGGRPAIIDRRASPTAALVGLVPLQYFPQPMTDRVRRRTKRIREARPGHRCVGREYLDLLNGEQDFAMFWQTKPWDHLAGQLLAREVGFASRRFDGSHFEPFDGGRGLLVARTEAVFDQVRSALLD